MKLRQSQSNGYFTQLMYKNIDPKLAIIQFHTTSHSNTTGQQTILGEPYTAPNPQVRRRAMAAILSTPRRIVLATAVVDQVGSIPDAGYPTSAVDFGIDLVLCCVSCSNYARRLLLGGVVIGSSSE